MCFEWFQQDRSKGAGDPNTRLRSSMKFAIIHSQECLCENHLNCILSGAQNLRKPMFKKMRKFITTYSFFSKLNCKINSSHKSLQWGKDGPLSPHLINKYAKINFQGQQEKSKRCHELEYRAQQFLQWNPVASPN